MKISVQKISTNFNKETCFVHARGAMDDRGRFIITTQPLRITGCDVFYQMHKIVSEDGGKTWSAITPCEKLDRRSFEEGLEYCLCDATPMFHRKTGTFLETGHSAVYRDDNLAPGPRKIHILYTIFDEEQGDWEDFRELRIPGADEEDLFAVGSGCCQCLELPDGDILIPFYCRSKEAAKDIWHNCMKAGVLRCAFDGKNLTVKEMGDLMSTDVPRGFGEPSVVSCKNSFFLCIRNDVTGYVAKSEDGLHYDTPVPLCFDDGENAGNYNTQQHWLRGGDKLYLVYTRRAGFNDHVFRHRAPLFMAEFDTERMCLIRDTEVIVVPERGARLGNFGCFNGNDREGYVIASEWMQNDPYGWEKCAQYGSDNSIFVTKIEF